MHSLNRAASAIDSASVDSAVRNLKETTANMSAMSSNLERATDHLDGILVKVDSGGGSIGKLLNDSTFANDLHRVLSQLDSLSADLRKHPNKYVNVHVF